jgi:hypothetical protein
MTMTYEMDENNVITSITVDGTTFECNIQTDGTWDVVLPFVAYTEGENGTLTPSNILVQDGIDANTVYNTDGTINQEQGTEPIIIENKYTFIWPKDTGYNMLHFWDAATSDYDHRLDLWGVPDASFQNLKASLPFDTVGICLCTDGKSSTHTHNWTFSTPGTYTFDGTNWVASN